MVPQHALQAEPDIFNIVDPGTNIQCTWGSMSGLGLGSGQGE